MDAAHNTPPPVTNPAPATRQCPICRSMLPADAATAPFCSSRCRQIDLGRWASGTYSISRDLDPHEVEQAREQESTDRPN